MPVRIFHSTALIWFFLAGALGAGFPTEGWGGDVEGRYRHASRIYHRLAQKVQASPQEWREVAHVFYGIYGNHGTHRRGADGLYSSALALLAAYHGGGVEQDRERALARFQKFLHAYPQHRLADDSLMHIGELFSRHATDAQRTYLTYRQVLATYPHGDQAVRAQAKVAALEAQERTTGTFHTPRAQAGLKDQALRSAESAQLAQVRLSRAQSTRSFQAQSAGAIIKRLLYSHLKDYTRVILTVDEQVKYTFSELPAQGGRPPRFYIDLKQTRPHASLAAVHRVEHELLDKIRIRLKGKATRVVFDLRQAGRFQVKNLDLPHEKKIIIDLYKPRPLTQLARSNAGSSPRLALPPRKRSVNRAKPSHPASLRQTLGLKVKNVVIDPGHGGYDPGAVGFGVKEKNLALQLSRELRMVFAKRRPGVQVSLTREKDVFIPLGRRPAIAKARGADLFISIHLNAHVQERFHGIETYFLNLTSDASALSLAARENMSTDRQIGELNDILRDLLQDTNIVESSRLAQVLQKSLVTRLKGYKVRNLGVKQAPFMVLMGAEMPSVLVEAGFLTNRRENKRLRNRNYLRKIAEGIYGGLEKYMEGQIYVRDFALPKRLRHQVGQEPVPHLYKHNS